MATDDFIQTGQLERLFTVQLQYEEDELSRIRWIDIWSGLKQWFRKA